MQLNANHKPHRTRTQFMWFFEVQILFVFLFFQTFVQRPRIIWFLWQLWNSEAKIVSHATLSTCTSVVTYPLAGRAVEPFPIQLAVFAELRQSHSQWQTQNSLLSNYLLIVLIRKLEIETIVYCAADEHKMQKSDVLWNDRTRKYT